MGSRTDLVSHVQHRKVNEATGVKIKRGGAEWRFTQRQNLPSPRKIIGFFNERKVTDDIWAVKCRVSAVTLALYLRSNKVGLSDYYRVYT